MSDMNRREFLGGLGGVFAAPLAGAAAQTNVLLILSDQYHHAVMHTAGNPVIKTPNLDRLAAGGVRFEHAVCPTPFCSPSRASILTGLYPHKHGITYNVRNDERGLDPKFFSTEAALSGAGYACAQRGKWHLGDKTRIPGYAHDPDPEWPPRRGSVTTVEAVRKAIGGGKRSPETRIGKSSLPAGQTVEAWMTGLTVQLMEQMAAKPFMLTVSMPAPHPPWIVNDPYYSMYDRASIPLPANRSFVEPVDRNTEAYTVGTALGDAGLREYLGCYYGLCSLVDWNVGRLLDALDRLKLASNTLVIFMADHGDMQAGHSMQGKTNFSIYEETTRIPLLMRLPGRMPAGKVVQTQAGSCDIQPTILDYLGIKSQAAIHGSSLRGYIEGREDLERPIFNERERGRDNFQRTIRTIPWKYVYCSSGESQLYHLEKDPGETKNLIADAGSAATRKKLHADLVRWMRETGDPRTARIS